MLEKHNETIASLFLNFSLPPNQARQMQPSDLKSIFESKAFKDWEKRKDVDNKIVLAICSRLDSIIKAIGSLGKALTARRR
ncbi:hypothetical protein [Burkholderia gladioli]|uniref:hypothetical protein n=1 Tax=Burkholderia gladioli TaxID=28095 RepID=UPI00163E66BB|nr:hypothetical protein [Burkholderia gladioli]